MMNSSGFGKQMLPGAMPDPAMAQSMAAAPAPAPAAPMPPKKKKKKKGGKVPPQFAKKGAPPSKKMAGKPTVTPWIAKGAARGR